MHTLRLFEELSDEFQESILVFCPGDLIAHWLKINANGCNEVLSLLAVPKADGGTANPVFSLLDEDIRSPAPARQGDANTTSVSESVSVDVNPESTDESYENFRPASLDKPNRPKPAARKSLGDIGVSADLQSTLNMICC